MRASAARSIAAGMLGWWCLAGTGLAAEPRPFVWQLGDDDAPSFLMGSIHLARDGLYPLPEAIESAFASCGTLVVEADPESLGLIELQKTVARFAYYQDDRTLEEMVSDETLTELSKIFARYNMSPVRFHRMKPWYVAQVISVLELGRLGVDPQQGIDMHFLRQARGKKPVIELEGTLFQLMFLDHFNDKEQQLMLKYTLRDLERTEDMFDEIHAAWASGDPQRFEALFKEFLDENPGLEQAFDKLIAGRNVPMARKIRRLLADGGTYFIVVGAGHLVGERGLLKLLSDDGIRVKQLAGEPAAAVGP